MTSAEQAFADGFRDGQKAVSGNNQWSMSVHMDSYVRGFEAGGNTYLGKLRLGRLTEMDRKVIDWQREHMDAFDDDGNPVDPTDQHAAAVLDDLRAEAEAM